MHHGRARRKTARIGAIALAAAAGSILSGCSLASGSLGEMAATAAGIPVTDAFLANKREVAPVAPQPIDGVWLISTNGKRIRIEAGRAYALDAWLHAMSLRIRQDMVVIQNVHEISAGVYEGEDLPLQGRATLKLLPSGILDVSVKGMLGPAAYALSPVEITSPAAFASVMTKAGFAPVQVAGPSASRAYPPAPGTPRAGGLTDNAPADRDWTWPTP